MKWLKDKWANIYIEIPPIRKLASPLGETAKAGLVTQFPACFDRRLGEATSGTEGPSSRRQRHLNSCRRLAHAWSHLGQIHFIGWPHADKYWFCPRGKKARNSIFKFLSRTDNPLNCDCSLLDFADWLRSSTQLSTADRSTSICTTPPNLEGALVMDLPPRRLRCTAVDDDDDEDNKDTTTYLPDTRTTMLAAYTASLVSDLPLPEGDDELPISNSQVFFVFIENQLMLK